MTYTFQTVGPAIESYISRAAHAAITEGLVPEIGVQWEDIVRVDTGQNRASIDSGLSIVNSDPGLGGGPPRSRAELRQGVAGSKPGDTVLLFATAPHSAPRESLDGSAERSIAVAAGDWDKIGERAASGVKP